ncbi:MAG: alpha/beta hydrolase [Candidatus Dojkabacteria bacterium]|nr:alpha/beta hydrolase [Candidatus Dojkabacteria bacterium]
MHKVKIDGTRVGYIREGRGNKNKLLLLHPLFGNNKYYEESIKYLKDDFDILAPDFPGFGLSEKYKDRPHNLENYSETVRKLCKYMKFEKFHLAGVIAWCYAFYEICIYVSQVSKESCDSSSTV